MSVSVAMATFNGAAFLRQQLADLAQQSVLPSELVVCDDGSTDETLAILERFAADAPFDVRIHRATERLGYRANFMKCVGLCRGDLVAFCDQDDRWAPAKIETMAASCADPEVLLAFHEAEIVTEDERPLGRLTSTPRPVGTSSPFSASPWAFALGFTQMFRRSLYEYDRWWPLSVDPNDAGEPLAHDQWYFFLASTLGTIVNVGLPLVRYRQHDRNVFGSSRRSWSARLVARVASAPGSLEARARSATQRAVMLEEAAAHLSAPYQQRAIEGAAAYRTLASSCLDRAAIHAGANPLERMRSFAALVRANGYGAHPWRFGASALAMDLVAGLPGVARAMDRHKRGSNRTLRV